MPDLLEIAGLTKRFGGLVAINDVSLNVREREILSVIGPNGGRQVDVVQVDLLLPSPD